MAKLKPAVDSSDHSIGNKGGSVTLVEFGDFECPHCGHAHPLIQQLMKRWGSDIQFIFRNFPLQESHPHAFMAATAAEAAGKQGKFWQMHDLIFENQQRLGADFLSQLAKHLHLDLQKFADDWQSEPVQAKVEADFESGVRSGVAGTPTFFLNGQPVLTYDETYGSLLEAVEIELGSSPKKNFMAE